LLALFEILYEIEKHHGNGKTTALAQAAEDLNAILLVATFDQAKSLQPLYPNAIIMTAHNLEQIRSHNKPIFIDHYLLFMLAKNLVKEKDEKISELQDLMMEKLFDSHSMISRLERMTVNYHAEHRKMVSKLEDAYNHISELRKENASLKKSLGQSLFSKLFRRKND